jgi:hypothetical protein
VILCSKVWQRALDDVEGAKKVRLKLSTDFMFILVFASANDSLEGRSVLDVFASLLVISPNPTQLEEVPSAMWDANKQRLTLR